MKRLFQAAIFSAVSLSLAGCGHISISHISKKETVRHKEFRKRGYDLCHLTSCGPQALSDALREFDINKRPFQIGKEIQDNDKSNYRKILGVLYGGFYEITCPQELKKYIRSQGFAITETKDIKKVAPQNTAIFLLKGQCDIEDWHWITFPANEMGEIKNFFDEHTKIKTIYILNKNE